MVVIKKSKKNSKVSKTKTMKRKTMIGGVSMRALQEAKSEARRKAVLNVAKKMGFSPSSPSSSQSSTVALSKLSSFDPNKLAQAPPFKPQAYNAKAATSMSTSFKVKPNKY